MNPSREINTRILIRSDKFIDGWGGESALPLLEGELGFTVQNDIGILKIGPGPHITGDPSTPNSNLWSSVENNELNERLHRYTFYSGRGAGYTLGPAESEVLGGVKIDSNFLSPYYSNGIIIIGDGYVSMDYGNLWGDQFSFSQTEGNNSLSIDSLGTTVEGPLFTSDIVTSGSITADIISASELIAEQKTTGDFLTLRYNREDSPTGAASGLILHNLFKQHPDGPNGKIELRKEDEDENGNIWAGPEGKLQKVPYILDTVGGPQSRSVTYHPNTNTLSTYDSTFKITLYTDHTKPMPVNFNDTDTLSNPEQDIINASYIQEYPYFQEMRFRIPTLLTDFSDLAEVGAVSVTEKALWNRAVQHVIESPIVANPYIDREGSNVTNPTLVLPHIPLPTEYVPSSRKINGWPLTEDLILDTGSTYTAGNTGISIDANNSTISHYKPNISSSQGNFPLFNGESFTVIEGITLDQFGHVTQITSKTYTVAVGTPELFVVAEPTSLTITDDESKVITVVTKPNATVTTTSASGICSAVVTSSDLTTGIHKITCTGFTNMRSGSAPITITSQDGGSSKTTTVNITGNPVDPLTITSISPSAIWGSSTNNYGGRFTITFNRAPSSYNIDPEIVPTLYYVSDTNLIGNTLLVDIRFQSITAHTYTLVTVRGMLGHQTATGTFTVGYDNLNAPV